LSLDTGTSDRPDAEAKEMPPARSHHQISSAANAVQTKITAEVGVSFPIAKTAKASNTQEGPIKIARNSQGAKRDSIRVVASRIPAATATATRASKAAPATDESPPPFCRLAISKPALNADASMVAESTTRPKPAATDSEG